MIESSGIIWDLPAICIQQMSVAWVFRPYANNLWGSSSVP